MKEPPHEWLNKRKSKRPMVCFLPRWNNEGWIYSPPSHTLKEIDNQKNIRKNVFQATDNRQCRAVSGL